MAIYIGIDGGGSNLRVAAVDESLNVIAQVTRGAANPSGIGREASAALIQGAIREVLDLTSPPHPLSYGEGEQNTDASQRRPYVDPVAEEPHPPTPSPLQSRGGEAIRAVGIGVAGASPVYADDWLREVVGAVLPGVPVATATDVEIALVGANGERKGIIVVAGTGSVAFGVNEAGETKQMGGWGYLLGDKGSAFWFGIEVLRRLVEWDDRLRADAEPLYPRILNHLGFESARELIRWTYRQPVPVHEIAALAPVILQAADDQSWIARALVHDALSEFMLMIAGISSILNLPSPTIAFGGGLLTSDNLLSRRLVESLQLPGIPEPKYPPVIGAALLAKIQFG